MSKPVTGPVLDELTSQWIDGEIPAESYLKQARRLARESAKRDITKQDDRRSNGTVSSNGEVPRPD
jgi:hypothetical protein